MTRLSLQLLAKGGAEKLSVLAQVAGEHVNAARHSIINQDERVAPDAAPSAVGVTTPGACFQVSQEVMSPTSTAGVTTPGVCSQMPQDVGRLVGPAPIRVATLPMGTVHSAQDTMSFTLHDAIGNGTNTKRTFVLDPSQWKTSWQKDGQTLSAGTSILFTKQTQGTNKILDSSQPANIWWPTTNPDMVLVNLMWILQNLADVMPTAKRLHLNALITKWTPLLRRWEGAEKGDAHH